MNAAHLHLVTEPVPARPRRHFCGHCGEAPESLPAPRVCVRCGFGVVLDADAGLAPQPGDAFLVVDRSLSVCALSAAAETLLRVSEVDAVNRHLADFLVPAEISGSAHDLVALIVGATRGAHDGVAAVVRPPDEFGVRHRVRVGACGPSPAALLVFDES